MSHKEVPDNRLIVLACQLDVPADMQSESERDAHLNRTAELLDDALSERLANLVVLPELSSISYTRHCFSKPEVFAETSTGPSYKRLAPVARKHRTSILYGAPRLAPDGSLKITQFLIGPDGESHGDYDKLHLAQYGASMEKDYFSSGEELLVFDVNGVKCAPLICYDMRFPALAATLVQEHGVQVLLHTAAFFRDESFYSWHSFAMTRAMENQVYWLSLNRAGKQYGASVFYTPWVDENAPAMVLDTTEELRWLEVDPARIEQVREDYSFTADRLAAYSSLPYRVVTLG